MALMRSGSLREMFNLMKLEHQQQYLGLNQTKTQMIKMSRQSCRLCCPRQVLALARKNEVSFARRAKPSLILEEKTYMSTTKRSVTVTTVAFASLTSITTVSSLMDASARLICASSPEFYVDSLRRLFSSLLLQQRREALPHRSSL